jgi:hypothetical protein
MYKRTSFFAIILFTLMHDWSYAQTDTVNATENTHIQPVVFGQIFPGFSSTFIENSRTTYSFDMNTALLGVKAKLGDKVTAILIYDVAKTTGDISVKDSSGKPLQVSLFKGSDYTVFLKQAEVNYKPTKELEFAIGQLLSEQYLTVQDNFWGYRYVAFTMQERYKYGYPADFGLRMAYHNDNIRLSATVSNGEGPFYKQDSQGYMMYAMDIEFRPNKNLIFKVYGDMYSNNKTTRQALSLFAGYKIEKFRIGAESCWVENDQWNNLNDYTGYSGFVACQLSNKWSVLVREDYLENSLYYKNTSFSILGVQYEIAKNASVSLNSKSLVNSTLKQEQICLNVGVKF